MSLEVKAEKEIDVRILALSGRIFELITVWLLQKKLHIVAQQIDMQSFDIIVFDKQDKLANLLDFEKNGNPALISIKAREGHLNGVSFEEAERALEYGNRLGVTKLVYGACFFDTDNIGKFDIYFLPIREALSSATKDRKSIRFERLILNDSIPHCFPLSTAGVLLKWKKKQVLPLS